jgi:mersacidin/lichenicidin family type 2 lantibiotic
MDIIRAWKDEEYRLNLTEEQRALLLDNLTRLLA